MTLDTAEIARLREEYYVHEYIGVRHGCKKLWDQPCSRLRHETDHEIDGVRLTVWEIIDKLNGEHANRNS